MSKTEQLKDEAILEKLRKLSLDKKREILDFLEFLETRERAKEWLGFDEWAINLAKEKGFVNLTEAEIAKIVSDFRGGR
jgi:hypothetical protein